MKKDEKKMWVAIIIALSALGIGFASVKLTKQEDNFVEEAMEEVIKDETGLSVDITPGSREDD